MNEGLNFIQPKDAWDKLSLREKAAMMKVAVKNGIYDLPTIRQKYNEFAEGGSKGDEEVVNTDEQYLRTMERVAEDNHQKWGFSNSDEALLHALNDNTYNYRDFYRKYPWSEANATTHWTDEFKTVYHPTFSNESIYSGQKSQYNPLGLPGGFWSGDTFIPMAWQVDTNEYKKGGGIHIAPSKRGTFTAAAKKHGKSVQAFASQVLAHPENYSPAMRKKANFARNASHWKHGLGGNLFYNEDENLYGLGDWLKKAYNKVYDTAATAVSKGRKIVKDLGLDKSPEQHLIEWITSDEVNPKAKNLDAVLQHKKKHKVKNRSWYFDPSNNKGYRIDGDKVVEEFEIASGLNSNNDGYTPLARTSKGETDYSLNRNLMSTGAGVFTLSRKYQEYGEPMYMMREGKGSGKGYIYEKGSVLTGVQTNQSFHAPATEERARRIDDNNTDNNKVSFGCIYPQKGLLEAWTKEGLISPGDTVYIQPKLEENYLHYDPSIGRIITHYGNAPKTLEGKNYSSEYKLNNIRYNKGY